MAGYRFKKKTEAELAAAEEEDRELLEADERTRQADLELARVEGHIARFKPHEGLKRLRSELGMSQEKMANVVGVTRRTLQSYERGESPIPSNVIIRLAATYMFDIHRFFSGSPHSDNLRVRSDTAKVSAEVVTHLMQAFPSMKMPEIQRIAMEFVRSNGTKEQVSTASLFDSIRVVTGDAYVKEETRYSDIAVWEPEDFPADDT